MSKIHIHSFKSTIGELLIGDFEGQLCLLDWKYRAKRLQVDERVCNFLKAKYTYQETDFHQQVKQQLGEYLNKKRSSFDLPLLLAGSNFQQQVWQQLLKIPYGQTTTYLDLSLKLGDEKAIRAVASANGANGISIIVPCHRVIGSDGKLIGYAGGLSAKKKLLDLEAGLIQNELFQ
ncbi:MAG TPA: methylated-DNA--[protein]-cysteine S-methyltransferase [Niabella sp.]|nr:methylated-DNA--[protein]-cysteine S-methyltransferase [Niabella sp.]HOZ96607.1 methylated-DNA--[protein]-cysteine S-methyltransferase [Niabella sp.]HQW14525.1 methylated-DNA--[protein]-cysteine S-methyltransferase [Niabella sp.]HQX19940.1 methylated-DNA--[protein]-cysteine S-methyltransferase [Niabella sp.]HQX41183.1 methylated-DNA--[protein]-cysteine S-methyltransferase [Niabella sp.]